MFDELFSVINNLAYYVCFIKLDVFGTQELHFCTATLLENSVAD